MRPSFTLGIEEEYQTIDPQTYDLRSHINTELIAQGKLRLKEKVKAELHQSVVEVGTGICRTIGEAREEVVDLRRQTIKLAREQGLLLAAGATHPFADWRAQDIYPDERFLQVVERAWRLHRAGAVGDVAGPVGLGHSPVPIASAHWCGFRGRGARGGSFRRLWHSGTDERAPADHYTERDAESDDHGKDDEQGARCALGLRSGSSERQAGGIDGDAADRSTEARGEELDHAQRCRGREAASEGLTSRSEFRCVGWVGRRRNPPPSAAHEMVGYAGRQRSAPSLG